MAGKETPREWLRKPLRLPVAAHGFLSLLLTPSSLPSLPQPHSSANQCAATLSLVWEGKTEGAKRAAALCCVSRQAPRQSPRAEGEESRKGMVAASSQLRRWPG